MTARYMGMNRNTGLAISDSEHISQSMRDILLTPVGSRVSSSAMPLTARLRRWPQRRKRLKRLWIMRTGGWRKTVMAAIFLTKNNLRELSVP